MLDLERIGGRLDFAETRPLESFQIPTYSELKSSYLLAAVRLILWSQYRF
jgi:hypothetical protein